MPETGMALLFFNPEVRNSVMQRILPFPVFQMTCSVKKSSVYA